MTLQLDHVLCWAGFLIPLVSIACNGTVSGRTLRSAVFHSGRFGLKESTGEVHGQSRHTEKSHFTFIAVISCYYHFLIDDKSSSSHVSWRCSPAATYSAAKELPAMQQSRLVFDLGGEDCWWAWQPHSIILPGRIPPWTEPGELQSMGSIVNEATAFTHSAEAIAKVWRGDLFALHFRVLPLSWHWFSGPMIRTIRIGFSECVMTETRFERVSWQCRWIIKRVLVKQRKLFQLFLKATGIKFKFVNNLSPCYSIWRK